MRTYRGTLILLALLAILGAFVYFFELRNSGNAAATDQQPALWSLNADEVTRIGLRDGENEVTLVKGEAGKWLVEGATPADEWRVADLLAQASAPRPQRTIAEQPDDPAAYGLDKPELALRLVAADGGEQALEIGDMNPRSTGYYARTAGTETVYLIDTAIPFAVRDLVEEPAAPTPTPEAATPGAFSPAPLPSATP